MAGTSRLRGRDREARAAPTRDRAGADEISGRLQAAPEVDLSALAEWERSGRRGPRPEPSQPELEASMARCQEELLGLHRAVDAVSNERAAYVEKNRERLAREAHEAAEKAHQRATVALDEAAKAREALVEARRVETWARLYPDPAIGQEPTWGQLGSGLRRVLELLGTTNVLAVGRVLDALRADIDWVATAATNAQREKLDGSRPLTPEERGRARDQQLEGHLSLRRQRAHDARTAELAAMRRRT